MSGPAAGPSRRDFLGLFAAGSLVLALAPGAGARLRTHEESADAAATAEPFQPDLFVALAPDGALTIVAHRSEMGTGIRTALPLVLADELGADWKRVVLRQAVGDARYGDQNTDGSRSVRQFHARMRRGGAVLRQMLEAAAAQRWGVEAGAVRAENHQVVHVESGRSLGFGELVADARRQAVPDLDSVALRPSSQWRLAGPKPERVVPIADMDTILNGTATFGIDARLEGQLFAVIARPQALGDTYTTFDRDGALAVPGVVAVFPLAVSHAPHGFQALGGVAVLANSTFAALEGRRALAIDWKEGPNAGYDSEAYERTLTESARLPGKVLRNEGHALTQLSSGTPQELFAADYHVPLLAHASLEPPCALARVTTDELGAAIACELWAPTQNPQAAQGAVASALAIPPESVTVHVTLLGGGFGRKSKPDFLVEAALLAHLAGRPVHVLWTREDDLQHDYYHTVASVHMSARIGTDGQPRAWLQRSAFPPIGSTFAPGQRYGSAGELGMGFTDVPFKVPHLRVENAPADAHVRIGWLRSVAHVYHAFATSCFADELAHRAGRDPLEYLLELLGEPRHIELPSVEYSNHGHSLEEYPIDVGRLRRVTERAAELADWGRELPAGSALGIASHRSFLAYCANVVEVEVSKRGVVRIPRVHVVIDAGLVVHPERVRAQMEGAAVFGASLALFGEITATKGRVQQTNFHTYPIARLNEAPTAIHVEIIHHDGPPAGVGETGVPPFAPALCNAIFAATGKRIRRLPLARHDLSW